MVDEGKPDNDAPSIVLLQTKSERTFSQILCCVTVLLWYLFSRKTASNYCLLCMIALFAGTL